MVKRTVILPTRDNDGRSLRAELERIQRELLSIAGGFTSWPTSGAWIAPDGRVHRDRGRAYVTVLEAAQDLELTYALPHWAHELRQLALYTDVESVDVSFVAPEV